MRSHPPLPSRSCHSYLSGGGWHGRVVTLLHAETECTIGRYLHIQRDRGWSAKELLVVKGNGTLIKVRKKLRQLRTYVIKSNMPLRRLHMPTPEPRNQGVNYTYCTLMLVRVSQMGDSTEVAVCWVLLLLPRAVEQMNEEPECGMLGGRCYGGSWSRRQTREDGWKKLS
ncbi:hypothetical protein NDU88_001141 [Pleurodeles waltl]|uniref:Uncharacterized protein n=1 Tax=Pleurodeles waltl TaxID=8319 RepID=A0AAV7R677_PLEWA|nr:hypothetical protein NDU88_001141 [Pleurodeles waltl]